MLALGPMLFFLRRVTTTAGGITTARMAIKTKTPKMIRERRLCRQRRPLTCLSSPIVARLGRQFNANALVCNAGEQESGLLSTKSRRRKTKK
ncbi:hypothetical protein BDV37DRAFT_106586 [Aspergillus pseudonomiae]|uniref:Secreted protein n=1 Tax=Aspergillus pseudonomiae TaxID=1506151 RepID=A0A5N7CRE0_9EURO|nr:uncharacterized protein BDV37DRAFT_106586 [Aspergillus pseudonomiae]KAE8396766.1 hypothetical protein BDV37DRAFT_106586 [Aspergillus pseudonomiae]